MPLYDYVCSACGIELSVIRSLSHYDDLPTAEEAADTDLCCHFTLRNEVGPHVWARRIGGKQTVLRGPNWNGAKGYWGKA